LTPTFRFLSSCSCSSDKLVNTPLKHTHVSALAFVGFNIGTEIQTHRTHSAVGFGFEIWLEKANSNCSISISKSGFI
jgi:hypothetical protein